MSPLAIAFSYPYAPSETFIRTHVENLAPSATVALAIGSLPAGNYVDAVELGVRRNTGPFLFRKMAGLASLLRTGSRYGLNQKSHVAAVTTLRRHGCETIFVEYGDNALALASVAEECGCNLCVYFHGFDLTSFVRLPGVAKAYRGLFPQLKRAIVGSTYLKNVLLGLGCPRDIISVVPYGLDFERFSPQPIGRRRGQRFAAVGRLVDKKAPLLTIDAFRKVLVKYPDATLDIVGDGPLRASCEAVVRRYNLSRSVRLHGAQSNEYVKNVLADIDVFVQHSVTAVNGDTESFGVSIVEAMAMGIPVVVTDHNGFSDTIVHNTTGFLVPELDVIEMSNKMMLLIQDVELALKMGEAGKVHSRKNFDYRHTIPRLRQAIGYG
jgi:colanic acid/amylovoran biosynthesis glycosyltransferase